MRRPALHQPICSDKTAACYVTPFPRTASTHRPLRIRERERYKARGNQVRTWFSALFPVKYGCSIWYFFVIPNRRRNARRESANPLIKVDGRNELNQVEGRRTWIGRQKRKRRKKTGPSTLPMGLVPSIVFCDVRILREA